jgi:hypothetical protein
MKRFHVIMLVGVLGAPCGGPGDDGAGGGAQCYDYDDCPVVECENGDEVQECDNGTCVTDPEKVCP